MNDVDRKNWIAACDRAVKRLAENKEPKLESRLRQEVAIIENLLKSDTVPPVSF